MTRPLLLTMVAVGLLLIALCLVVWVIMVVTGYDEQIKPRKK